MAAGFQATLSQVNGQGAGLVISLRNTFVQIQEFKAWLDTVGHAGLVALGMSGSAPDDAATLISAFNDLNDLAGVFTGAASTHLTGTYDYRTFAKLLIAYN